MAALNKSNEIPWAAESAVRNYMGKHDLESAMKRRGRKALITPGKRPRQTKLQTDDPSITNTNLRINVFPKNGKA